MKQIKKALVIVVVGLKYAIIVCEKAIEYSTIALPYMRKALEYIEEWLKRV